MFTSYEFLYLGISVLVALMMLVESRILAKTEGKFLGNPVLSFLSLVEFVWLVLSVTALFKLSFASWSIVVPVVYILFNLSGWIYGMYLFKKEGLFEQIVDNADDTEIALPKKHRDFTLSFTLVFLVLSVVSSLNQLQAEGLVVL